MATRSRLVDHSGNPFGGASSRNGNRLTDALLAQDTLALASLVGRKRLASRAGVQFGGKRDIFSAAGYVPENELGFEHFYSAYKRGDIAGRIVDMPAQTTWRKPPELVVPGEEDSSFVDAFNQMAKRLRLWNRFERVDRLAGIGRYAVLFIGTGDGDDVTLRQPIASLSSPDDVLFLTAVHEKDARVAKWVTNQKDPRYLLPEIYDLKFAGDLPGATSQTTPVHWSRVIHVAEDALDNDVFGRPRLERSFNRLQDLDKILAATGESYWQLAQRILVGTVDEDAEMSATEFDKLGERTEEIIHGLRRQFFGQNVDLKWLESAPPDPANTVKVYLFMIAAASGIPMRILFGTETGERASEQDERQWHGTIMERQERFAEPDILRTFVDRLITLGAFEAPPEYEVVWPNLYQPTPEQQAEANKALSEVAKNLSPMGGDPRDQVGVTAEGELYLRSSEELEELGIYVPGQSEVILPNLPPPPPEAGEDGDDVDDAGLEDEE